MGRVARYKKEKKVFDVDQVHRRTAGDVAHDDEPSKARGKQSRTTAGGRRKKPSGKDGKDAAPRGANFRDGESKTKARKIRMLRKVGPDGKFLDADDGPGGRKRRREDDDDDGKAGKSGKGDSESKTTKNKKKKSGKAVFKLEGKKKDETYSAFLARVNRETQEELDGLVKQSKKKAQKGKLKLKERKHRIKEKKLRKLGLQRGDGFDGDMEREVYQRSGGRAGMHDIADAPPEWQPHHNLKNKKTAPDDRKRFAKLSSSSSSDSTGVAGAASGVGHGAGSSAGASTGSASNDDVGSKERSAYGKLQMEAMRIRVLGKYDELRAKRQAAT